MSRKSRHWLWLLMLIPIGIGFARLRFDVEVLNLLPGESPVVQGIKLYQQNFANARELIITIKSSDAEQAESSARAITTALRAATNLVADANWQPPWLENPGQAAELVAFLWLNQPPDIFGQLTNRLAGENLTNILNDAREALATSLSPNEIALRGYDPYDLMHLPEDAMASMPSMGSGQEFFSSKDGTFRIIFVEATSDLASYRECLKWLNSIKDIVATSRTSGNLSDTVEVHYTGRPAFVAEIAGGMEHDMFASVGGTMVIIALLFWLAYRRWRPLLWLLTLLALILGGTTALGGLLFRTINVVSMGFAAILLGLAVDYGLVLYQEAQTELRATAQKLRQDIAPSIIWSAITTAGAFLILNLSSLPGLAQLGSLVAIGVALAAVVMLFAYLPPLLGTRGVPGQPPSEAISNQTQPAGPNAISSALNSPLIIWGITGLILLIAILVLAKERPAFDHTADALRPRNSPAYAALEEIKSNLGRAQEPLWILVPGRSETEVARRLEQAKTALVDAESNQVIHSFTLASSLWPRPEHQQRNRPAIEQLLLQKETLRRAALAQGFTSNSFALTENLFDTWQAAISQTNIFWPTNRASHWVFSKLTARRSGEFIALGLIYPATNGAVTFNPQLSTLNARLARDGILLSGWELLGASMFDLVKADLPKVLLPMLALLLISLWLAYRRLNEVLLSLATLLFSGLCLYVVMDLAGWSWNLLNLMALPLLLGAGVDYSIHMQLALRRHGGDINLVRRSVGRALFLCGGTTVAGFGSLSWSNNAGLASLGQICSVGILCAMLTAIYLLPVWWRSTAGRNKNGN